MSSEQVLKFLREMFPDRLVLYAADLAKVLGVSEKALAHLVERGRLPFTVKLVGNRRCVDIFQVADWLAARDAVPEQQHIEVLSARVPAPKSTSRKAPKEGVSGGMSKRLIAMRQSAASCIAQQFVGGMYTQEAKFWIEVAEHLAMFEFLVRQGFSVRLRWFDERGERSFQGERISYFDSLDDAHACAAKFKGELGEFDRASITIRSDERKVYHSFKLNNWIEVINLAE